ncbi:hypothetical protein SFC57_17755 [Niallia circulans]|uniref:hypothetical protein n=1 Tax=Niallia circulans TaxID=1397 RepID=UPI00397DBFF8
MLKKKVVLIFALVILLIGGCYYLFIYFSYQSSKDFFGFPVPRNAEIIRGNETTKTYKWSSASEEHGIPFGYAKAIQSYGWKKGEQEGALVYYSNGEHQIILISLTEIISIEKVK